MLSVSRCCAAPRHAVWSNTTGGDQRGDEEASDTMQGYVEAGAGNWGKTLVRGSIDVLLSDTVLTKFSAYYVDTDGYLENRTDGKDYNEADLTGSGGGSVAGPDSRPGMSRLTAANPRSLTFMASWTETTVTPCPYWVTACLWVGNRLRQRSRHAQHHSNLAWDAMGGTANFILGSRSIEQDFLLNFPFSLDFFPDFFIIDNQGEQYMFSAELKWSGTDGRFLQTGVYYMDEDNEVDFVDYLDSPLWVFCAAFYGVSDAGRPHPE